MTQSRRQHERVEHRTPVTIVTEHGTLEGTSANIGSGGIFVELPDTLPFGTAVTVRLRLPAAKEDMLADATVRWHQDGGMGLQFGSLRAKDVWALNQLFKSQA